MKTIVLSLACTVYDKKVNYCYNHPKRLALIIIKQSGKAYLGPPDALFDGVSLP
jgi:hypothetical protein